MSIFDSKGEWDYELSVRQRAMALAAGCDPYFNIAPFMQLIRDADRLDCIVCRKPSNVSQYQPRRG